MTDTANSIFELTSNFNPSPMGNSKKNKQICFDLDNQTFFSSSKASSCFKKVNYIILNTN